MQFLMRSSTVIVMVTLALAALVSWVFISVGLFRTVAAVRYFKNTSCESFIEIARNGTYDERKTFTRHVLRMRGDAMILVDASLARSDFKYMKALNKCLDNPKESLYVAIVGFDPKNIDFSFMSDMLEEVVEEREAAKRAVNVTPPNTEPSAALMQKFNQEIAKARAEKAAYTSANTISPTLNTKN